MTSTRAAIVICCALASASRGFARGDWTARRPAGELVPVWVRALEARPEDSAIAERIVGGLDAVTTRAILAEVARRAAREPPEYGAELAYAQLLLACGRFADAARRFELAATLGPEASAPHRGRARALGRMGDARAAVGELRAALKRARGREQIVGAARELRGAAAAAGDLEAELEALEARRRANPADAAAILDLAAALARAGRPAQAAGVVASGRAGATAGARRSAADEAEARWTLAEARYLLAAGDLAGVSVALGGAPARRARMPVGLRSELWDLAIETARRRGTLDEAKERVGHPRDLVEWQARVRICLEQGDFAGARGALDRAIELDPGNLELRRQRIGAIARIGHEDELAAMYEELAGAAFRTQGEGSRGSEDADHAIVEALDGLWRAGRRDAAGAIFDRALSRARSQARSPRALAEVAGRWADDRRAVAAWTAALARDPSDEGAIVALGEARFLRGQRRLACDTWRELVRIDGGSASAHVRVGELFLEHDLDDDTIAEARAAMARSPRDPGPHRLLATLFERRQRVLDAEAEWESVARLAGGPTGQEAARRTARARLVGLWAREGAARVDERLADLERSARADGNGNRERLGFLVDAKLRLGRTDDAAATLERIWTLGGGDASASDSDTDGDSDSDTDTDAGRGHGRGSHDAAGEAEGEPERAGDRESQSEVARDGVRSGAARDGIGADGPGHARGGARAGGAGAARGGVGASGPGGTGPDRDAELIVQLVAALRQAHRAKDATTWLERLARRWPARARDAFLQLSDIAFAERADVRAEEFARQALAAAPGDGRTMLRVALGEERLGHLDEALETYRGVTATSDRATDHPVAPEALLARAALLMRLGRADETRALLRGILRDAPDDDVFAAAGQQLLALEEASGSLPGFETFVAELPEPEPTRAARRQLLVSILGRLVPAAYRARATDAAAAAALAQMARHGLRAVLDAAASPDAEPDTGAIELLGMLGRSEAVPVLARLVTPDPGALDQAHRGLDSRARLALADDAVGAAMVALGRLGGDAARAALEAAAATSRPSDRLRILWALGRVGGAAAAARARAEIARGATDGAAIGCLSFGRSGGAGAVPLLVAVLEDARRPELVRRAAALGLGLGGQAGAIAPLFGRLDAGVSGLGLANTVAIALGLVGRGAGEDSRQRLEAALRAAAAMDTPGATAAVGGADASRASLAREALEILETSRVVPDDALGLAGDRIEPGELLATIEEAARANAMVAARGEASPGAGSDQGGDRVREAATTRGEEARAAPAIEPTSPRGEVSRELCGGCSRLDLPR